MKRDSRGREQRETGREIRRRGPQRDWRAARERRPKRRDFYMGTYVQSSTQRFAYVFYDLFHSNASHGADGEGTNQGVGVVGVLFLGSENREVRSGLSTIY